MILILGIVSSITCFGFIFKKLKINHVIKKLLLVVTVQQSLGYAISLVSILAIVHGIVNKLTCFVGILSITATLFGTQALISMISIIRYFFVFSFTLGLSSSLVFLLTVVTFNLKATNSQSSGNYQQNHC